MKQIATFGGGCFWHIEYTFGKIRGVLNTKVGYMGGNLKNPSYEDVCSNETGHIEVTQVEFDPKVVSYNELLDAFFKMHNPTTPGRQGLDIGTQYKSTIFYHTLKQKDEAVKFIKKLDESKKFGKPIVTEVRKASTFYKAEEYHQKYVLKHGVDVCPVN